MLRTAVFVIAMSLAAGVMPATAAASAPADHGQTPVQIVKSIADQLADALQGHRQELRNDKPKLIGIIDKILLPHFDVDFASILVLGRHARQATPEQREQFANAFYNSIINRYAEGLLNYTRGAVTVLPNRAKPDARRTIVRTEVKLDNGKTLSIDYAFHKTPDGTWKAYDVIVAGISYIGNYRNQVDAAIRKEGLNALIHHLQTQGGKALKQMQQGGSGAHS